MSEQPAALQLRLLQTVVAVAAEKNSTLVLPFPVELLRFLERASSRRLPAAAAGAPAAAGARCGSNRCRSNCRPPSPVRIRTPRESISRQD